MIHICHPPSDSNRVKSTINGTVTTFVGNWYEVTGSQVTKYYFAGSQRVAMRKYTIPQPMTVEYFLGDQLGSTSVTTDNTGAKVSEMRYKPWGEVRSWWTAGLATTPAYMLPNYTFTGQYSYMDDPSTNSVTEGFGLMFYNARWYDPSLGRFVQADTIIPGGVQGYDRYAYANNDPMLYTDPSGHDPCDEDGNCYNSQGWYHAPHAPRISAAETWKRMIRGKFGITMADDGDKPWSLQNLRIAFNSLVEINGALNGKLISFAHGWTFKMRNQDSGYYGHTSTDGTMLVEFFTDNRNIVRQNIFHEVGHVLDNVPGMEDIFSHHLGINNADFLDDYGKLDTNALIDSITPDMYQHPYSVYTDDASEMLYGQAEHWADMFANYVAGNIDLDSPEGRAMNDFVEGALRPYTGIP